MQEFYFMKNFEKIKRDIFKGVINSQIFAIFFALFFSSLANAAAPGKTWKDARIPSGIGSSGNIVCTAFQGATTLWRDRTENPYDVIISEDGLTIFTVNGGMQDDLELSMNKLRLPNQLKTTKTAERALGTGTADCGDIDGFNLATFAGSTIGTNNYFDINISRDGKTFIFLSGAREVIRFDLTEPYNFKTASFTSEGSATDAGHLSLSFSRDGKTMFSLDATVDTPIVKTFSLPSPFDITSRTEISSVNLTSQGYSLRGDEVEEFFDIEFNRNGSEMFILSQTASLLNHQILQFSLGKNYDPTTATYLGAYTLDFTQDPGHRADGKADPFGFAFSSDGMNLYYVQNLGQKGVDRITHIELECSFGIIRCSSDSTSSIGAQVELAKQNITQNVSVIFKRFEWIKRNRDQEDFTSHNINLNFPNPILEALAMKVEPTTKRTMAKLISTNQKKGNKSKWSSWSLGEISFGDYDKLGFENQKRIKAKGLIFGADRKLGQNKFLGWALRYGNSSSNVKKSVQGVDMESFTLNLYGTIPRDDYRYINTVLGLSVLNFDNKYNGKLSGERNGKQAFASINYRTKNSYGALHFTPTLKIDYGVTRLSEFTDFISTTIDASTTDVRYAEDTFKSGELATGFLFETDKFDVEFGTFQPMGSIEYVYDLTPDVNYKYTQQGETIVNKDKIIGKYSESSLKTNIGFEAIYSNGFTVSPSYERTFSLSHDNDSKKVYSERLIVKFSRSKEDNNSEYAFNFEPLADDKTGSLSYVKNINGFDLKLNSNFDFKDNINYLTNFEVSGKF